jgi:hypothetical protein
MNSNSPSVMMNVYRCATIVLCTVAVFQSSGCGPAGLRPVKVDLARETLIQVLDHWKSGGTIEELGEGTPQIVVQEALWANGKKLADFKLVDDGRAADANWFCEVELTLESDNGGVPTKKSVTYVVGTHPVLTVFHAIL